MHGSIERHIIVNELDFSRLTRLLEQHDDSGNALAAELERAILVRPSAVPKDVVTMNCDVEYEDENTHTRRTVRIVYPRDADAERGCVSVLAPIGSALLGLRIGQSIRWPLPDGPRRLRVLAIPYQPEAAGHHHL